MKRYSKKELQWLIDNNIAIDITYINSRDAITEHLTQIGYRTSNNGLCGKLFQGDDTKQLYCINNRTSAIFIF